MCIIVNFIFYKIAPLSSNFPPPPPPNHSPQDLESSPKTVSFAKNGSFFGTAYELDESLKDQALFPHIATKNVVVSVNFAGPLWCETPDTEGYQPIQEASDEHKVRAPRGPASLEDCEVVMLVGLPASGKTTWAMKHCAQNQDKKYNILGEWVGVEWVGGEW